jgi:flavin-dependent dehydrogenase
VSASPVSPAPRAGDDADVIVVGAGPGGSSVATYLARSGLDVLVLEKTAFPREKVCGDGLTPRAVKELAALGVPTPREAGWIRNKGLRIIGGGVRLQLPWPDLAAFPDYGLVRPRRDFDEILARVAQAGGAKLQERVAVTGPVLDDRTGRVVGVTARPVDDAGAPGRRTSPTGAAGGCRGRLRSARPGDGHSQARRPPDGVAYRPTSAAPA